MPTRTKKNQQRKKSSLGSFRIIAGKWRSRRLSFPVVEGLRPTTDRVRETVFNWLADRIVGAEIVDLFAGSGSLGFEALSRGASHLTFVERDPLVVKAIYGNLDLLEASAEVVHHDALHWLACHELKNIDIIFLDPPFRRGLLDKCVNLLDQHAGLRSGTLIYLEMEKERGDLQLPCRWQLLKEKTAGQVSYCLYCVALDS